MAVALGHSTIKSLKSSDDGVVFAERKRLKKLLRRPSFRQLPVHDQRYTLDLYDEVAEEAMVREARLDPVVFAEYCMTDDESGVPIKLCDMHVKWQRLMGTKKQLVLIGPREHGKSTMMVARIIWELGNDPNLRIKIVSNNDANAIKRVTAIQRYIVANERVRRVFPWLRPAKEGSTKLGEWNKKRLYVEREGNAVDPSVEAYSVLGGGTGGRADILVLDDVADRKNSLLSKADRAKVITTVRSDWLALVTKEGWVVDIATLWHKSDLHHDLGGDAMRAFTKGEVPDQTDQQAGEWYVSFDAVGENFEPVWAEQWPVERLKAKYVTVGRASFNRGWRNYVVDDEETVVDPNWIHFYETGDLPPRNELIVLQSYDLALSKKESDKNAYFAGVTMAVRAVKGVAPTVYVMDAWRKRLTFPEQVQAVKDGYKALEPDAVLIESIYYQAALGQQLVFEVLMPVVQTQPVASKRMRLEACTPIMESAQVLFSRRLDPERSPAVSARGDVVGELKDFPFGDQADLVDATTQGINYIQKNALGLAEFRERLQQKRPQQNHLSEPNRPRGQVRALSIG